MAAIQGRSIGPGVAIATGAIVQSAIGISGISPDILQQGINALRRQLTPVDFPEVVVVCDMAAAGLAAVIPGIKVIGVAAESDTASEDPPPNIPCVVGLKGLLESMSSGDLVIVDGDKGVVQLDPDPKVLIAYQHRDDARVRSRTLFIESRHLPAKTQAGETVHVYARASDEAGLMTAVAEGADALVVEPFEPYGRECYERTLKIALGKPTMVLASSADKDLLRAAARLASAEQVSVLFPASHFAALSHRLTEAIEHVAGEMRAEDLDPPSVTTGVIAVPDLETVAEGPGLVPHLVDLRGLGKSKRGNSWVEKLVIRWVSHAPAAEVLFDVGDRVRLVDALVSKGARNLVTTPNRVSEVKNAVRVIGLEEVD